MVAKKTDIPSLAEIQARVRSEPVIGLTPGEELEDFGRAQGLVIKTTDAGTGCIDSDAAASLGLFDLTPDSW